jgi:SAM-dependent methyltransferase
LAETGDGRLKSDHLTADDCANILDGKLTETTRDAARQHLEVCPECWEIWNWVRWKRADSTVDLIELRAFLGDAMLEGVDSSWRLAEEWNRLRPSTQQEVLRFYENTEWYLYNLLIWHASGQRPRYGSSGIALMPELGYRTICDFGCGVGTDGLIFAEQGYEVYFVDVNVPALKFVKFRLKRRGLRAWVGTPDELLNTGHKWDVVWVMDVIEHLPDPGAALRPFLERGSGFMYDTEHSGPSGGRHPFHFNHSPQAFAIQLASFGLEYAGEIAGLKIWMKNHPRSD